MTKKELINKIRLREGMTWEQATRIVNDLFGDIADCVVKRESVYIPKFGKFYTSNVNKKRCRHPETREFVMLPPHSVVSFRMAEDLRRKLEK